MDRTRSHLFILLLICSFFLNVQLSFSADEDNGEQNSKCNFHNQNCEWNFSQDHWKWTMPQVDGLDLDGPSWLNCKWIANSCG